ncbi:NADPH-dependent FMN reductase [Reichenbachiella sp. 5M10]|uniref:NADPH-dependent FMN reductase n=1 Tax=Reichenbachiella sp. 5M10 TaxID=1889772 RepID=UPI000C1623D2|nr:NAD(P)H-dependent oxidoreductase [Reichenbachiella sp. 5M10]PIB36578.1 NADPH-dependent FMN reductase [Reichenbachiella sp. 5M10]
MRKVVAFGASSSSQSINKRLATWAAYQLAEAQVQVLDLNDYEMPIFSVDKEKVLGQPSEAVAFKDALRQANGILISFAEHNGNFSAAFKNIFDWASRIEPKMWLDKPMFLLATSDGKRGGQTVLEIAVKGFPHRGGDVVASFSLPQFKDHFEDDRGITDEVLLREFHQELTKFSAAMGELSNP